MALRRGCRGDARCRVGARPNICRKTKPEEMCPAHGKITLLQSISPLPQYSPARHALDTLTCSRRRILRKPRKLEDMTDIHPGFVSQHVPRRFKNGFREGSMATRKTKKTEESA